MENEMDTRPDLEQQQRQCRAESAYINEVRHATLASEDDDDGATARKTPVEER